jgi:hypothetical protein
MENQQEINRLYVQYYNQTQQAIEEIQSAIHDLPAPDDGDENWKVDPAVCMRMMNHALRLKQMASLISFTNPKLGKDWNV